MIEIQKYIEIKPEKRFGKPTIIGTRISVYDVLNWLASGMSNDDIMKDFPEIKIEMIQACLAFAASKEANLRFAS